MPLYEFRCTKCGEEFDMLVSLSHPEPLTCPRCGGKDLEKKISMFASAKGTCSHGGAGKGHT